MLTNHSKFYLDVWHQSLKLLQGTKIAARVFRVTCTLQTAGRKRIHEEQKGPCQKSLLFKKVPCEVLSYNICLHFICNTSSHLQGRLDSVFFYQFTLLPHIKSGFCYQGGLSCNWKFLPKLLLCNFNLIVLNVNSLSPFWIKVIMLIFLIFAKQSESYFLFQLFSLYTLEYIYSLYRYRFLKYISMYVCIRVYIPKTP